MQKIKFDFEATKQLIYAPNSTAPIGAPVDADGNVANDGTAIGIVLCRRNESNKYWVKQNLVVMVAGYCDIIDAQEIWGDEYSAEAKSAMSDITFCDNHELPTGGGGGWPADLPKPSVGGYGYTESGEQTVITWDGDTTGKIKHPAAQLYCVSDAFIDVNAITGAVMEFSNGAKYTFQGSDIESDVDDGVVITSARVTTPISVEGVLFLGGCLMSISADYAGVLPKGVYFLYTENVSGHTLNNPFYATSLTYGGDTVHKIDEKYLPVIPSAPSDDGTYTLTCTVTDGEPVYSWES